MDSKTARIRALNDELRHTLCRGRVVITLGVATLDCEVVARIIKMVQVYDDFGHANDPHQEHDFGSFQVDGHTIFFKIDYYDKAPDTPLWHPSPDPSDPALTHRAITIMLAEEY